MAKYKKIFISTRLRPDTIVAIFILKKFGTERFPGVESATLEFLQTIPEGETADTLEKKGVLLIDLGGGTFDHHGTQKKSTASYLVARELGIAANPSLAKLLEYARRDDFFGKGTISNDALDRAFGLSGLVAALNKKYVEDRARVVELILPLLEAHLEEEVRRTEELPREVKEKMARGEAEEFTATQDGKDLKVIVIESDNASMPGYLRSRMGGAYDVVAQRRSSGHLNILTRPAQRVDLRPLIALIRLEEIEAQGKDAEINLAELERPGRIDAVPQWYYDPATNSLQNGGLNPKDVAPTSIKKEDVRRIIELGLSRAPLGENLTNSAGLV